MKDLASHMRLVLAAGMMVSFSGALAQDSNATAAVTAAVQSTTTLQAQLAAPRLPYGVEDVLKLTQAKISEDIILSYVQNSGTIYNLAPNDIVYLRNQGVSDRVLNAMVGQRKQVELAAQAAAAPQVSAPLVPNAPGVPDASVVAPAPVYDQPPVVAQPAPSTMYVIPDRSAYNEYYPYYGYPYDYSYPYYGGYYGPVVSFGFGFGGRGHFGGGFHGGGFHGGGFHGGGGGTHVGGGFHGGGHR